LLRAAALADAQKGIGTPDWPAEERFKIDNRYSLNFVKPSGQPTAPGFWQGCILSDFRFHGWTVGLLTYTHYTAAGLSDERDPGVCFLAKGSTCCETQRNSQIATSSKSCGYRCIRGVHFLSIENGTPWALSPNT
jgi:hypothetical protein